MSRRYEIAAGFASRIERELRRLGRWREEPPQDSAFDSQTAFFADTMSFEQWLQFVLLPRIAETIAEKGKFPKESSVGAYAVRWLDGDNEADPLKQLLSEFDWYLEEGKLPGWDQGR